MIEFDEHSTFTSIEEFLVKRGWLEINEHIFKVTKAGEGNMNVVLRVVTNFRSFILKQSRPFVQKYQDIPAPLDRIKVEKKFYELITSPHLNAHIPKVLGFHAPTHTLILEDLGKCEDMSRIYTTRTIDKRTLMKLVTILKTIHQTTAVEDFPSNIDMRKLNHQHIFILPFMEENGFSLDSVQEGLQALSIPYKKDAALKMEIEEIGKKYLAPGNTLLHGDYYPGSWMTKENNLYVIDPEFGFVGFAEFDLGVLCAHLILATDKASYLSKVLSLYDGNINTKLTEQIAGIEIMRRLIGLAQLPLKRTLEDKKQLLQMAHKLILS